MAHAEGASQVLAQTAKLLPKKRNTVSVASATIGKQQNGTRLVVSPLSEPIPSTTNRVANQLTRVGAPGQIDQGLVGRQIVDESKGTGVLCRKPCCVRES